MSRRPATNVLALLRYQSEAIGLVAVATEFVFRVVATVATREGSE